MQKQKIWESSYGGDHQPAFIIPCIRKNNFLFQDLRKKFECPVSEKITRTHFIRDPTSSVGQLSLCHLAANVRDLILRSSLHLPTLFVPNGISL